MRKFTRLRLRTLFCIAAGIVSCFKLDGALSIQPSVGDIVLKSVAANTADWKAQPQFGYRERIATYKLNSEEEISARQVKTYEVTMIDGSPYNRLVSINGKHLSPAQDRDEERKLKQELRARESESVSQRKARMAKFHQDRSEERLLMNQMVNAFKFRLVGEQRVNGYDCYVLDAQPDPNYQPPVEKARVLAGMKGRLYIDKIHYHWVKVEAEVTSPVNFGLFLAKVKPGTKFELVQTPVGDVWLPKSFSQSVNASVLGFYGLRNHEEDTYSDYHHTSLDADVRRTSSQ